MLEPLASPERLNASLLKMLKSTKEARCPAPLQSQPSPPTRNPIRRTSSAPSGWSKQLPSLSLQRSSAAISPFASSSTRDSGSSSCILSAPLPHPRRSQESPTNSSTSAPTNPPLPQLTGWWLPSDPGGRYAHFTILFFPDGNGSLADSIPTLASLHNLGINIFAFDYRGYGQSAAARPSQQKMTSDADAAWQYLTTTRAISAQQIIPYGMGVGVSFATRVASQNAVPALILDSPRADLLNVAIRDPRATLVPVRLLFHDHFPLAEPLSTLHTPKLLLIPHQLPLRSLPHCGRPQSDG